MSENARLLDIVGQGYQNALEGDGDWRPLMDSVAHHFDAEVACLKTNFIVSDSGYYTANLFMSWFGELSIEIDDSDRDDDYDSPNPITKEAYEAPRGRLIVRTSIEATDEMAQTAFHESMLKGVVDHYVTVVHESPGERTLHFISRAPSDPVFSQSEIAEFALLSAHLHRAAVLATLNGRILRVSRDSLDFILNPIILLDGNGKIVRANIAAQQLLQAGDGIRANDGRLILTSSVPLATTLRAVLANTTRSFSVYRSRAKDFVGAVLSPAPAAWTEGVGGLAALVLSNPGNPALPSTNILRDQYNLTEAEARFARQFVTAKSLARAAMELGISAETARRHIKAVFEKSGTHSQVELTQLLLLHPEAILHGAGI